MSAKAIVAEPGIIPVGKTAVAVLTDHLRKMLIDTTVVGEGFDCLVSMRGQDNDAVRGQMAAEETKQVLNSLAIEMRDERAAPDQIKLLTEIKRTAVLCGVSGTHVKRACAEVYRIASRSQAVTRALGNLSTKKRSTRPWPHGRSSTFLIWSLGTFSRIRSTQCMPDRPMYQ